MRTQLQSSGVTVDTMKAQVSQKQKAGVKYDDVYYIGSFEGKSGLRYFFYAITYSGIDSSGQAASSEDAITFTVAPDTGAIYDIGIK